MPVQSPLTKKSSIVHRSESLRSEVSDASQQSKRVSFNRDVHVKRIPRGSAVVDRNGKLVAVLDGVSGSRGGQNNSNNNHHPNNNLSSSSKKSSSHPNQINGRLWVNSLAPSSEILPEEELLREAQTILKHVDNISCTTTGGSGYDTKSLERNSSRHHHKQNGLNNNNNNNNNHLNNNSASGNKTKLQKSSSRLSEFFSKTLPNQIRNKYNNNNNVNSNSNGNKLNNNGLKLTKSTQNLHTHTELERNASTGSSGTQSSIDISHIGKSSSSGKGKGSDKPRLKLKRSVSSDLSFGNLNGSISKSDPNLYKGGVRYKKVAKIKKPHGIRVALNSIGETPTNSSASGSTSSKRSDSDSNSNSSGSEELPKKELLPVSTSDSPVSSLSGPEEPIMANSSNFGNQHRVSSIVQQLSNPRRSHESPERNLNNISSSYRSPLVVVEPLVGNTHNNNKPFSYISGIGNNNNNNNSGSGNNSASVSPTRPDRSRSKSPLKNTNTSTDNNSSPNGKILSSPKEVIYAQVVCSGKPGESGSGEKRTVHTTVTNGVNNNTTEKNSKTPNNSNPNSNRSSPQRTLLNNSSNNHSPSVSPNKIQHFVYDHPNNSKKFDGVDSSKLKGSNNMNHHSSFRTGPGTGIGNGGGGYRSLYDDYDFSTAKPRNNVTTVLLNNVDDDDDTSFSSSRHNINSHTNFNHRNYRDRSPSPSPNYRKPEQSFYFGNSPSPGDSEPVNSPFSSSSFNYKSPSRTNGYLSSSREVSPAAKTVSSALLVRDAERKKGSLVSSAKLVSTYGVPPAFADNHNHNHNQPDYDYRYDSGSNNMNRNHRNLSESPTRQSPSRTFNSHHHNTHAHADTTSFPSSRSTKYGDPLESPTTTKRNTTTRNNTTTSSRLYDPYPSSNLSSSNTKKLRIGSSGSKTVSPNASNSSVNKIGLRSKENSPVRSYDRDYTKSTSPGKSTMGTLRRDRDRDESSLERKYNRKNKDEQELREKTSTLKTSTITNSNNNNNNSGGGGMFSTLMRRNKDKKIQKEIKEKEKKENLSNNEGSDQVDSASNKESKIKRQRAKFFSAFLDKNFSSKNKNSTSTSPGPGSGPESKSNKTGKNMAKPTDSEIEDAERRRDGEYHSWSSGDDEYRFGHQRNGQLTRGKSYNFGDLNEESGTKPWYDQNDSDYRRDMATSRYTSATLGRPGMRSSNHNSDNDMSRSKSLDRRAYKHRSRSRSPAPRIIVTPNTPQIEESDKWKNTYDPIIRSFDRDRMTNGNRHHSPTRYHPTLSKKTSGLSKSSYELDGDPHHRQGSSASSKLRYFGDTDAEYADNSSHHLGKSQQSSSKFIPRSSSYLSRGKENYSKYYTVPGSSLNSSGSENGSRMSNTSQRSVYLHAPAVASIPPTSGMQRRTLSRDELSNYSGSQKQTKHLARSMSVLAPWRPRHYRERYEVNYSNNDTKENQLYTRPPKPPRSPTRKSMSPSHGGSTDSLLKLVDDRRSKSPSKTGTLTRKEKGNSLSRSKSMPKDTRLAGWRSTLRWPRFGGGKDKGEKGEGKT